MGVPTQVYRLVEQFDANLAAYKSGHFDEAQVRVEHTYGHTRGCAGGSFARRMH